MTNDETLQQEKSRLDKLMREEMLPFITKTVEENTTTESIDETKRKEIINKYDTLYKTFETNLLNIPPPYQELREKEYLAQGITPEIMTIALWEDVVEKRPEARIDLQAKREAVKQKYPKG